MNKNTLYTKAQKQSQRSRTNTNRMSMQGVDRSQNKGESLKSRAKQQSRQTPMGLMISKVFGRRGQ
jgi:hypothetical protein